MVLQHGSGAVRVLLSVPPPRPTTNPYVVMLAESLRATEGITVHHFSWAELLSGRYDVFHVHWPETLTSGSDTPRTAIRHLLLATALLRMRLRGTPVVRTLHNLEPHERTAPATRTLLAELDRLTTATISLNPETRGLPGAVNSVIPHGHYVAWFSRFPTRQPVAGRLVSFGALRRYKNLDRLVSVFRGLDDPHLGLTIAGPARDRQLADQLSQMAAGDPRVALRLGFVEDHELVELVTSSSLVVLPYAEMHNSGAALAALSLRRPVLVPCNDVNRGLAREFGREWVRCYEGELSSPAILEALAYPVPEGGGPDLSSRDWDLAGTRHRDVYLAAMASRRRPRRPDRAQGSGP